MPIVPAKPSDWEDIRQLLQASGLPTADLAPTLPETFLVLREGQMLAAVVGLEAAGADALLRSLAVSTSRRGGGLGRQLVDAAETLARAHGVRTLYLLTTTAADYFSKLGYRHASRDSAPAAIRQTTQFSSLCPASSSFMSKHLDRALCDPSN